MRKEERKIYMREYMKGYRQRPGVRKKRLAQSRMWYHAIGKKRYQQIALNKRLTAAIELLEEHGFKITKPKKN